jgi:hypothetical protein
VDGDVLCILPPKEKGADVGAPPNTPAELKAFVVVTEAPPNSPPELALDAAPNVPKIPPDAEVCRDDAAVVANDAVPENPEDEVDAADTAREELPKIAPEALAATVLGGSLEPSGETCPNTARGLRSFWAVLVFVALPKDASEDVPDTML